MCIAMHNISSTAMWQINGKDLSAFRIGRTYNKCSEEMDKVFVEAKGDISYNSEQRVKIIPVLFTCKYSGCFFEAGSSFYPFHGLLKLLLFRKVSIIQYQGVFGLS